jgi:hypothetical protein
VRMWTPLERRCGRPDSPIDTAFLCPLKVRQRSDSVIRVARRSQHPVGRAPQAALTLELLCDSVVLTNLGNLILLCYRHHWMIHEGGCKVERGRLLAIPPPSQAHRSWIRGPDVAVGG